MSLRDTLEKMLRAGQTEAVLQGASEHFRQVRTPSPDDAWIAAMASWAAGCRQKWGLAVDWARQGLALDPTEPEVEGRLRLFAGTALFYTDDLYGAEQELNRFLDLMASCPALSRYEGDARYNLAYVMRGLKRTDEQIALFTQAVQAYERLGRRGRASACHHEVGWSYLLCGKPAEALPELQLAQAGLVRESDDELAVDVQIGMALYHSLMGDLLASDGLCEGLAGRMDLLARQRADLAWVRSRNAMAGNRTGDATRFIEEAYAVAVEEWIPTQLERIESLRSHLLTTARKGR